MRRLLLFILLQLLLMAPAKAQDSDVQETNGMLLVLEERDTNSTGDFAIPKAI